MSTFARGVPILAPNANSKKRSAMRNSLGPILPSWKNQILPYRPTENKPVRQSSYSRATLPPMETSEGTHLPALSQNYNNFSQEKEHSHQEKDNVQHPSPVVPTFAALDIFNVTFDEPRDRNPGRPTTSQLSQRPQYNQRFQADESNPYEDLYQQSSNY